MALIHIGGKCYELLFENRNGWNAEMFRDRYSDVLDRYDYIVGDWGYNQLRLKGFFRDNHSKATKESSFSSLTDYINEYCNFGCAYFVIEKVSSEEKGPEDEEIDKEETPVRHRLAAAIGPASAGNADYDEIDAALEEETAMNEAAAAAAPAIAKEQRRGGRNNRRFYGNRGHEHGNRKANRDKKPHRGHGAGGSGNAGNIQSNNDADRS